MLLWSVRKLQQKLGEGFRHYGLPQFAPAVDGKRGPATIEATRLFKLAAGWNPKYANGRRTPLLYAVLLRPSGPALTKRQKARGYAYRQKLRRSVRGQAAKILDLAHAGRVRFWDGLSTGSERARFVEIARTGKAWCPQTERWLPAYAPILAAIIDAASKTPIMVNALTGGRHGGPDGDERTPDSRHFFFRALDLDNSVGDHRVIDSAMAKHGGVKNSEKTHRHYDF